MLFDVLVFLILVAGVVVLSPIIIDAILIVVGIILLPIAFVIKGIGCLYEYFKDLFRRL